MKQPKISVCIPVYNGELYLTESIQSIIDQTFTDWEIIVVNDNSTDFTSEICFHFQKLLGDKFKYVSHSENLGIAVSRNNAVNVSSADIICVQDADDLSHKERLQKVFDYFKRHKKIDLVFGSCQYVDALGRPFHQVEAQPFLIERLRKENWIQHPTVAYRKKAFQEVGGYRPECKVIDDWFLYYDFWKHGKVLDGMNDVLAFYRVLPTSVSRSPEKSEEIKKMKEKFLKEANADTSSLAR